MSFVKRRRSFFFVLVLLSIEFLDEFVFGAREAAWPLIRDDLGLSYAQVGLLLTVPSIVSNVLEPILAVMSDLWRRRALVLGGGLLFAIALLMTAGSRTFGALLASFVLLYPASGAFVSLSQATLMDLDPSRREQSMARWTFAGSAGVVLGPLVLASALGLGLGWRELFVAMSALTAFLLIVTRRMPYRDGGGAGSRVDITAIRQGLVSAVLVFRRREVLRWLVLLEFSDLLLDVFLGFLALYFVDVVGASPAQAGIAVAVWTGAGLAGDLALIPLLERVRGLSYLRVSAALELVLFVAFLLVPGHAQKVVLAALLGFFNSGWYAIPQAQLYAALPGQSGMALAAKNLSGLAGGLIPLALGLVAQRQGLPTAMWLLIAGPAVLLVGLPRRRAAEAARSGG